MPASHRPVDPDSPGPTPPGRPDSDGPVVKIVPKGLRSFDQHDADFFLELLPGPATATACPRASGSGRPGSSRPTPTPRSGSG